MPQIYELLGYPISDKSDAVENSRKQAYCPFMKAKCDGGGNRFMSQISLKNHPELKSYFSNLKSVPSGVCSIQLLPNTSPWIICPRRLLYMGNNNSEVSEGSTEDVLFSKCQFHPNSQIGIWAEVKVIYSENNESGDSASFNYAFDYVMCQIGRKSLKEASELTETPQKILKSKLTKAQYTFASVDRETVIEDFPIGKPYIIEVMTSSTSGGNKKNRSCIPLAFEDCILGKAHKAPGINYRQVWARMASQMIVKSQAAIKWGGHTIWVLQDLLTEYISSSTALDLRKFINKNLSEVNILSFSYSNNFENPEEGRVIDLIGNTLFAGPIRPFSDKNNISPSFQDIVLAAVCPPKSVLLASLCKKPPVKKIKTK